MGKMTLAVIYGGHSCEHDVSIISGLQAAEAAQSAGYDVVRTYIDREGRWFTGQSLDDVKFYTSFDETKLTRVIPLGENDKLILCKYPDNKKHLLASRQDVAACDAAIPVMHGMNGEDGTLQGLFEMLDVPYASSGVTASAIGMDKIAMKRFFTGCGFPVIKGETVERDAWQTHRDECLERIEASLGYPVFTKPANLGSSIGINRADDRDALINAIDVAASFDRRVLVEKAVLNMCEVNCAVMGYAGDLIVSETEMPVSWDKFLTYDEKYLRGGKGAKGEKAPSGSKGMTSLRRKLPAPIGEDKNAVIKNLSREIFRALDCRGVARIDFIIDKDEDVIYVNEINTIPGSLAFYLFEPVGLSFPALIDKLVDDGLKAHADKRRSVFSYDSNILRRGGGKK
ncbi:MAG: D-alanine--D-alanine ligase family protein [Clostridia bacterium]|nr:D-alanine--D-alanine ligase family protein [Clostridia bacterium]